MSKPIEKITDNDIADDGQFGTSPTEAGLQVHVARRTGKREGERQGPWGKSFSRPKHILAPHLYGKMENREKSYGWRIIKLPANCIECLRLNSSPNSKESIIPLLLNPIIIVLLAKEVLGAMPDEQIEVHIHSFNDKNICPCDILDAIKPFVEYRTVTLGINDQALVHNLKYIPSPDFVTRDQNEVVLATVSLSGQTVLKISIELTEKPCFSRDRSIAQAYRYLIKGILSSINFEFFHNASIPKEVLISKLSELWQKKDSAALAQRANLTPGQVFRHNRRHQS